MHYTQDTVRKAAPSGRVRSDGVYAQVIHSSAAEWGLSTGYPQAVWSQKKTLHLTGFLIDVILY
jgi:hypothetical protein